MDPTEEQIRELMATVACTVCGSKYRPGQIEVLGHRDTLWFVRVNCGDCASRGVVAAMIRPADGDEQDVPRTAPTREEADPALDRPRVAAQVTRGDVARMRKFLRTFDGDFHALFDPDRSSRRPAA